MAARTASAPSLKLAPGKPSALRVDALIVPVSPDSSDRPNPLISSATGLTLTERRRLVEALTALGATGKADEVVTLARVTGIDATTVVCVGLGALDKDASDEQLRRAAGAGVRSVDVEKVGLAFPVSSPSAIAAVAQGALLGAYRFTNFRGKGTSHVPTTVKSLTVVTSESRDRHVREAVRQAEVVAEAVNRARDLVNTPPSALHPVEMADAAQKFAAGSNVTVEVLDEEALAGGGYGGIMGVGQGSVNPPRLIQLTYTPTRATAHIALVGKGITFDSGGLSLKPAQAMETMKCDMGGAAAVIAATFALAQLGVNAQITAYAACAENMPSGTAQRPGDVLTTYGGTTVEVLNTDAEGRLVLADALQRAAEDEPDLIVDVATLTGAQMVALGTRVSAVMANDDDLRDDVVRAADTSGEQFWPMPLPVELRPSLDSPIADLANIGDRMGGMLTAGLFLQEFIPADTPWAHLDIAGPAFNTGKAHDYTPVGGTGASVRTLVQLVRDLVDARSA